MIVIDAALVLSGAVTGFELGERGGDGSGGGHEVDEDEGAGAEVGGEGFGGGGGHRVRSILFGSVRT